MATNEHFLLVNLAHVAAVADRVAFTIDEVIQGVKKERISSKLTGGSQTATLVKKALRKLDYNDHIKLQVVDGQAGFRFTKRGLSQFKKALQDCPRRRRRAPRSSVTFRARDVLRIGSFLKKKLIKESDDILEEMRSSYGRVSGTAVAMREQSTQVWQRDSPTISLSPSSSDQFDLRRSSASPQFVKVQPESASGCYPSLRDVATSESESERRLHSATSESEQERRSLESFGEQCISPASTVDEFPSPLSGTCCATPRSLINPIYSVCENKGVKTEIGDVSFFAFGNQDEHLASDRSYRRFSLDSQKTLVDPSSLHDYFPVVSVAPRKRVVEIRDEKHQVRRSSSPESDLVSGLTRLSRSVARPCRRRGARQDTVLVQRGNENGSSGLHRHHPYKGAGEALCVGPERRSRRTSRNLTSRKPYEY